MFKLDQRAFRAGRKSKERRSGPVREGWNACYHRDQWVPLSSLLSCVGAAPSRSKGLGRASLDCYCAPNKVRRWGAANRTERAAMLIGAAAFAGLGILETHMGARFRGLSDRMETSQRRRQQLESLWPSHLWGVKRGTTAMCGRVHSRVL